MTLWYIAPARCPLCGARTTIVTPFVAANIPFVPVLRTCHACGRLNHYDVDVETSTLADEAYIEWLLKEAVKLRRKRSRTVARAMTRAWRAKRMGVAT